MRKKDTSYSDAMNDWAAKQSFLRNRKNRLIHPNPELPMPLQILGYLFRVAIVVFIFSLILSKLSTKYFNGTAFNEEFKEQLQTYVKADEIEATGFSWQRDKAGSRKITAMGSEEAFYRSFEAIKVSFRLPLWKRIRKDWSLDELMIDRFKMDLKSGGKTQGVAGTDGSRSGLDLMTAGIFPSPKLADAKIEKISCTHADLSWGLSQATLGAIDGTRLEVFSGTPNWRMDLSGGTLRQNWLSGVAIESLTVRRDGSKLSVSNGVVRLGNETAPGSVEGSISLERLPKLDLNMNLPEAKTRELIPKSVKIPEFFHGVLDLSLNINGSINTLAGVEMSGQGKVLSGVFSKVPVFEAIDQLLKTSRFRIFSIEEGEIDFTTSGGKLNVTNFTCKSKGGSTAVRGNFIYTPAITGAQAAALNEGSLGNVRVQSQDDAIEGKLYLGVRPRLIEDNELAASFFTESSDGYVWIEIPLDGPISRATKAQHGKILAAVRGEG